MQAKVKFSTSCGLFLYQRGLSVMREHLCWLGADVLA
jgi:hypothetical protein